MPRFNPLLEQLATYPAVAVDKRKAELVASGQTVYDFGKGDPEEPPPAFVGDALKAAIAPRLPYPRVKGSQAVREAIAAYAEDVRKGDFPGPDESYGDPSAPPEGLGKLYG